MHSGKITNEKCMAGRLYGFLREHEGETFSNLELMQRLFCPAISTRVSEVRAQLDPARERIVMERSGMGFFYRLERVSGVQLELAV
jgi:hypothetical protein